jgi:hypothetical protein
MELGEEAGAEGVMPMLAGIEECDGLALPHAARARSPATVGTSARKRTRLIERMVMEPSGGYVN